MPAKKKNNKGQEMSLGEFLGPNVATGGEHDWAEEVWDPSTEGDHGQNASAAGGAAGVDRRFHDNRYNHDRSALGTKTNFRDATSKVPDDMPPPYVAHLGNLKTGITKEELCAEFFPDKIVECRLITRDERSTFAFLEFQDVRTLQLVLLMVDRVVLGRKVRIDVASPEQIARMTNHGKNNEGGFGKRFGGSEAGGHSSAGLDQLDRDVFGTGSPVTQGNNRNFRGNNNNNNNNNGPMSADAFSDFRSGPTMMQHGGGGSMMDLDNWRDGGDAPQAQQPAFPGDRRRGGNRSPTASGAPSFGGGGRRAQPQQNDDNGTTAQSPTTEGNNEEVGGSWRDAPRQAQPELMSRREQPTTDNNSNAAPGRGPRNPNNNNNNKETSASSSSTQQQAPAAAAAAGDRGSFFGCSVQPNNNNNNNNNNNAPTTTNTNAAAGEKRGNNKKSQGPQSPTTAVVSAPTTTTTTTTESPAAPTAVAAATPAKPSSWAAAVTAKPAAVAPPVAPSSSSAPAKQIAARPASGTNNNQKPAAAKASSDDRFKR